MIALETAPEDQSDRLPPACEACREAELRGETVYCSCLRIPTYTSTVSERA